MVDKYQPKGDTWEERATKGDMLQAVMDPADRIGRKNRFIDLVHRITLSEFFPQNFKGNILDLGCGTGRFLPWLSKKALLIIGIDITKKMLKHAKESTRNLRNVELILCDGTFLPFREESLDLTISVWVLQHILRKEDFENAVKDIVRSLKIDGRAYLIEQVSKTKRMPGDYIDMFKGYKGTVQMPIRRSRSMLSFLVQKGFTPSFIFPLIARLEILLSRVKPIPEHGYADFFFIFQKEGVYGNRYRRN
jgi:ubiquinone/menaquinone biosynthesis C-methylase UbiE